jgi:tetratricopeptide (TPR) repeat protein
MGAPEAEPLFRRALRIWEEQLGPEHPDVAFGLWGLARISARQGRASQAEALFARALAQGERHLGELHVRTAQVLHDFAGFQHGQGRAREAAVLYQRALTTRQRLLGPDHPLTRDTRQRLQEVLAALDQRQDAAPTERESGPRVSS